MPIKQLVEKREELATKQKKLRDWLAEGNSDPTGNHAEIDLDAIKSIDGDRSAKLNAIRKLNEELETLGGEVDELAKLEGIEKSLSEEHEVKGGEDSRQHGRFADNREEPQAKGIGDIFVETEMYKNWLNKGATGRLTGAERVDKAATPLLKTTFETGAGWAPESTRIGRVVESAERPIQVIDTIPGGQTGMDTIKYMEETTFTNSAAERTETGVYAESTLALTEQSRNVIIIGTSIPVTDIQLADVPMVRSYLNQRLTFMVRQHFDGQVLTGSGSGSPEQLLGINNASGINTQALGSDPIPDAVYKGLRQCRVTGRANPNMIYAHPNDWQSVRLLRTADGIYIWGNPSEAGPMRMWGVRVVETDAQTENTILVGDTQNFVQLFMRQDVVVEIGLDQDDFTKGIQTIRAGLRAAQVVYRATAFCQVTGV